MSVTRVDSCVSAIEDSLTKLEVKEDSCTDCQCVQNALADLYHGEEDGVVQPFCVWEQTSAPACQLRASLQVRPAYLSDRISWFFHSYALKEMFYEPDIEVSEGTVVSIVSGSGNEPHTLSKPSYLQKITRVSSIFVAPTAHQPLLEPHSRDQVYGRKIQLEAIDFSQINSWLATNTLYELNNEESQREGTRSVPVSLIDIHTRRIVPKSKSHSQTKYAALSYVWGKPGGTSHEQTSIEELPVECLKTVEDAITVTKNLGLDYLWVDQYCISRDEKIRHSQIARMDIIYKKAFITIIAAAGQDANHGLPGISIPRVPMFQCEGGLVQVYAEPTDILGKSKYSTRAWTYQEKIFSSRSLIFTPQQVFFESRYALFSESLGSSASPLWRSKSNTGQVNDPLALGAHPFTTPSFHRMRVGIIQNYKKRNMPRNYRPSSLRLFRTHVELYSQREMTYGSDALNAMAAILEEFERRKNYVKSAYGIPYEWISLRDHSSRISFCAGLSWVNENWRNQWRRRDDFPTWSWTSCDSRITWLELNEDAKSYYAADVNYEWSDASVPLDCQCMPPSKVSTAFSIPGPGEKILRGAGNVLPVDFNVESNGKKIYINLKAGLDSNPRFISALYIAWRFLADIRYRKGENLVAVKLAERHGVHREPENDPARCEVHLMVITEPKFEGDTSERVGLMKVPVKWYREQEASMKWRQFLLV